MDKLFQDNLILWLDHVAKRADKTKPIDYEILAPLADEVARLMEWTRQETLNQCNQPWEPPLPSLTLPRPEWKP